MMELVSVEQEWMREDAWLVAVEAQTWHDGGLEREESILRKQQEQKFFLIVSTDIFFKTLIVL